MNREEKLSIIILAAGKGTRMKSELPKVLHKINRRSMIDYVIETAENLNAEPIIIVVGYKADMVKTSLSDRKVEFVLQQPQLGTGHAVLQAEKALEDFPENGDILVLYGDVPFTKKDTLENLIENHREKGASATILTTIMLDPTRYGRIIRNPQGSVEEIVEATDASFEQKRIKEINTGIICFRKNELFEALKKVQPNNRQGEVYLTDTIKLIRQKGLRVEAVVVEDSFEVMGLDTKEKLRAAEKRIFG